MSIRILHVIESIAPQAGSAAITLRGMMRALTSIGASCEVVAASGRGDGSVDGLDVLDPARLGESLQDGCVLHVHGWGYDLARRAVRAARRRGVPLVISPYGSLTRGRYRRPTVLERLRFALGDAGLIRGAVRIDAINEFEATTIRDQGLGVPVAVSPPGILFEDDQAGSNEAAREIASAEGKVLLVLGPLEPVYGGVPLLKAFAECGALADGWRLVFAGAEVGDWRKQMEAAVRRKGGGDRVTFTQAGDLKTQRYWLRRADALACVALHPTCPTSVLQGLAWGLPVFATAAVALDELSEATITCAPTRDGIGGGLRTLLEMDAEARRSMGVRGREAARSGYEASNVAERYLEGLNGVRRDVSLVGAP